jgi:hypothetical protein
MKIFVISLFVLTLRFVLTNAMETLAPQDGRLASTVDEASYEQSKLRSIIAAPAYHFNQTFAWQEPREIQECVSCFDNRRHRQLKTFPKLLERVKNAISLTKKIETSPTATTGDELVEIVQSSLSTSTVGNASVGNLFDSLAITPMNIGVIALALVIILPLVILETLSITLQAPILCILGFDNSFTFGSCDPFLNQKVDATSLQVYFPDGVERIPNNTTDVAAELADIIDIGLSVGIKKYLNQVALSSVLTKIAKNNATNPLVAASLVAILPLLSRWFGGSSTSTQSNPPTKCKVGKCRHRRTTTTEMDVEHSKYVHYPNQCEMEYISCELNNAMAMLGGKNN